MALVLPLFVIPLVLFMSLVITMTGHFAHHLSEQVRVDAVTLSLCHHRKNFIEESIVEKNQLIEKLQITMDIAAIPCLADLIIPEAAAICEAAKAELKILSRGGSGLEKAQDIALIKYMGDQQKLKNDLISKNDLTESFGDLRLSPFLFGGFSREETSYYRKTLQFFTGSIWPHVLKTNASFSLLHTYKATFFPNRIIIGVGADPHQWKGFNTKSHKNVSKLGTRSSSGCRIVEEGDDHFTVKRFL
ncbi:MAG: hypothetical protein JWQ35_1311 [Bacteriovoracaceae bacterium]|nr:hypothetical protein [Bacteriovoracaceae bacterium]